MKFEIYSIKGGYTAEVNTIDEVISYRFTVVGVTISAAVDDALYELGRFKKKCLDLGND